MKNVSLWQRCLGFGRYLNQMYLYGQYVLALEGTLIKFIFMTKTSWYKLNLAVDRPRVSGRRSRNWWLGSVSQEPLTPVKLLCQRLLRPSNDWSGRYSVGVLLEKDSFLSSILLQQTHRASPVCVGGDTPVAWCLVSVNLALYQRVVADRGFIYYQ